MVAGFVYLHLCLVGGFMILLRVLDLDSEMLPKEYFDLLEFVYVWVCFIQQRTVCIRIVYSVFKTQQLQSHSIRSAITRPEALVLVP